jgi:hypothetical protein
MNQDNAWLARELLHAPVHQLPAYNFFAFIHQSHSEWVLLASLAELENIARGILTTCVLLARTAPSTQMHITFPFSFGSL